MTNLVQALRVNLKKAHEGRQKAGRFGNVSEDRESQRRGKGRQGQRKGRQERYCSSVSRKASPPPLGTSISVSLASGGDRYLFQLGLEAQKARLLESCTHIHTEHPRASKSPRRLVSGRSQRCWRPLSNAQGWLTGSW